MIPSAHILLFAIKVKTGPFQEDNPPFDSMFVFAFASNLLDAVTPFTIRLQTGSQSQRITTRCVFGRSSAESRLFRRHRGGQEVAACLGLKKTLSASCLTNSETVVEIVSENFSPPPIGGQVGGKQAGRRPVET